ncbi:MAG: hypothetical protein WC479_00540 [Candidatus Izemoplasmatales bacterium]
MKNIRDILRSRRERDSKLQPKVSVLRCVTVGIDYPNDCAVKNRPGYIWVQEQGSSGAVFQVFNTSVKRLVGLNVLVSSEYGNPFRTMVISMDWDITPMTSESPVQNSPTVYNHATSHEWQDTYPGADAISIYPRALIPLRVYPAKLGDLKVDIVQGFYIVGSKLAYYEGEDDYDLTAYKPAGGYVGILIYLNPITNAVASVVGTAAVIETSIVYPDVPLNILPLAYVKLSSTATLLNESDIVLDIRPLYTINDTTLQNALGALENEFDIEFTRHVVGGV